MITVLNTSFAKINSEVCYLRYRATLPLWFSSVNVVAAADGDLIYAVGGLCRQYRYLLIYYR